MTRTVPRADAVATFLAEAAPYDGRLVLLLDGGSGAGKTVLADELAERWQEERGEALQVVHLDDVYPGWRGLAAASRTVVDTILRPTAAGYRRWDWVADRPADWVSLDPTGPILVEGCGALTVESAPLAPVRIWVDLDEPVRRQRALARDVGYEPWWDVWAEQERAHWQRNRPWELATLRVLG